MLLLLSLTAGRTCLLLLLLGLLSPRLFLLLLKQGLRRRLMGVRRLLLLPWLLPLLSLRLLGLLALQPILLLLKAPLPLLLFLLALACLQLLGLLPRLLLLLLLAHEGLLLPCLLFSLLLLLLLLRQLGVLLLSHARSGAAREIGRGSASRHAARRVVVVDVAHVVDHRRRTRDVGAVVVDHRGPGVGRLRRAVAVAIPVARGAPVHVP